jgi:monoamine oxidase
MQPQDRTETEVVIIGGGLSGLALAHGLHRAGIDVQLFEARARFGGRIAALSTGAGRVDLGPSWIWPGQDRVAHLVADLGLSVFAQHASGDILFEDANGHVQRGAGFASMAGALRVAGGMVGLVEGLVARLPDARLHPSSPVETVGDGWVRLSDGRRCHALHIVLALPPRLAASLRFEPALPDRTLADLAAVPTWMAGHAKFVAVYTRAFWREAGLSGDAISRHGPLAELHDACGPEGAPAALFGFAGLPAAARAEAGDRFTALALEQLVRLFGPEAAQPLHTTVKDWARTPWTATAADQLPPRGHPAYAPLPALRDAARARLHLAATEVAPEMGGLIEGALAAAERVAQTILSEMRGTPPSV